LSLPAAKLNAEAYRNPRFMDLVLQFVQAGLEEAKRCVACNALHRLPARLARWLLVSQDRVDRPLMMLTQDNMSMMTGALRSSISMTAGEFKQAGLITYSRGHVEILDRDRLERRACECYSPRAFPVQMESSEPDKKGRSSNA
jgi:CRP-like cAMP-binding protein